MSTKARWALALVGIIAGITPASSFADSDPDEGTGRYIVVLKNSVDRPGEVAAKQTERHEGDLHFVYRDVLEGYAATLPEDAVDAIRRDPRVAYVSVDHRVQVVEDVENETENNGEAELFEATIPSGVKRTFATNNAKLDIDGLDDVRIKADVAVLDTGIDLSHPDLNVIRRTNCVPASGNSTTKECIDSTGSDGHSHGTHVAGTIGALDNGIGVVGIAPGAKLWAVKVLNDGGGGWESWILAGVEWVTAHASEIEVANMSLGCVCSMPALATGITNSVKAGVVYVVAAGNSSLNASNFAPANHADVITVSALADYDGLAGGLKGFTCANYGLDDRLASFSNWGTTIEVAAPGVCTTSTTPGGGYGVKSGTSMASPLVAGAAAMLAATSNPNSKTDVEAIRSTIISEGNFNWTDNSGDGKQEPLLDVSDESVFGRPPIPVPAYSTAFGSKGTGNGQFGGWMGDVAVNPTNGTVAVADSENHRIQVFTEAGSYIRQFGSKGSGNGQFNEPAGVAFDSKGNIWVADLGNNRIQQFTESGSYIRQIGSKGTANGQFELPFDVTADSEGNVWVADYGNARVQEFTESGTYLRKFSTSGNGSPFGVTIDAKNNIWNTTTKGFVEAHSPTGVFIRRFGKTGEGSGEFWNPRGLDIDSSGNVWIADTDNHRIQAFSEQGEYLSKFGSNGTGAGQFQYVTGVAVDPRGGIWASDGYNSQIDKWVIPSN